MKLLVVGGTLFLGRGVVDHALELDAEVTLFNRGRTNPGLYPEVEHIVGDRDSDLSGLDGRAFDAVIDTSAYFPRQVEAVVDALDGNIGHYTFVSSMSVYADHSIPGADETAALATVADPSVEELGPNYGGFKALCETALDEAIPGRAHHVRAGLIVGPHDNTGRFSYWVERIAAGGNVLAPEPRSQAVQFIDVRDVARWMLHAVTENVTGAINANGTPGTLTMGSLLRDIQTVTTSDATLTWVDEQFLVDNEIKPWSQLPLWLPPESNPGHVGFMSIDNSRALELGLELRPVEQTIAATLADVQTPSSAPASKDFGNTMPEAGLTPGQETELLQAWENTSGR